MSSTLSINVLPPNASELEKSLVASFNEVLHDKDILIKKLYNTDECPSDFLVYLAWFFKVDFSIYNSLDDTAKREYIKQSINIHRKKGTTGALRQALKLDNYIFKLTEWYNNSKKPHTAEIRLSTTNAKFDLDFVKEIVNRNKNVQTIITYLYTIQSRADSYVGMACKVKLKYKI